MNIRLFILGNLFAIYCSALVIVEPVSIILNSPQSISTGLTTFNITGQLVLAAPPNGCQPLENTEEVAGNLVLTSGEDCALEVKARNAQAAGALGLIQHEVLAIVAGLNYRFYVEPDREDIKIPIVFINNMDGIALRELISNSTAVIVIMTSGEPNEWQILEMSAVNIFFTILDGSITLALIVYTMYKLVWYYKNKRTMISVAQVSMFLLIVGLTVALVGGLIGQISAFGYFAMPAVLYLGLIIITWTLLMLSSLVISFYWFDITSHLSVASKAWSNRLWRPFIVGGCILLCALVVVLLWIRYFRLVEVLYAIFIVYAVIAFAVAILWIVFGVKLRQSLNNQPERIGTQSRYRKLFRLIIASSCLLVLVFLAVSLLSWAGTTPTFKFILSEVARNTFEAAVFVQVMMFATKKKESKVTLNTK